MKKIGILLIACLLFIPKTKLNANEPDSAYVFAYATGKNFDREGLHYAWSVDRKNWNAIGPEYCFLKSWFGKWATQKKLIKPFLFQGENGLWHCLWTVNNKVGQFAHAATNDFYTWKPQSFPVVMEHGNVLDIEASYNRSDESYSITWISESDGHKKIYKTTTSDFRTYSPAEKAGIEDRQNRREQVEIDGEIQTGIIHKVPWTKIDALIKYQQWNKFHELERADNTSKDPLRFKDLQAVKASITVHPDKSKAISDMLIGIFFEDINYAADGGLYAELVQNRGFEYNPHDKLFKDQNWNNYSAWSFSGDQGSFTIDTVNPIHHNQKHYAIIDIKKVGESLVNEGFDGILVKEGEKYNFSVFVKMLGEIKTELLIRLTNDKGEVLAQSKIGVRSGIWDKIEVQLLAIKSFDKAKIEIIPQEKGKYAFDLISLFPEKTFKGRKNGLRADLAQVIADVKPRFVRFPGGCVAHGDGLDNMYRWNRTVGPLETRVSQRNIWNYNQSGGLGYFEYFQFCEDIGAEPLPVLPAGVPCQNSDDCGSGQQGGIPICEMDEYVQEVLDLIEWANGDKNTKWGKVRADAGHPEPFNLKYLGIGNEDLISAIFEERFTMIFKAVKEKYPEISIIGTVGPSYMGTDYEEGWNLATNLGVPMVDEHYYQTPGWFIHNQDYYDKYDRSKSKVYLGEYAAHLPGRPNNIETALSEALYMTSLERNGDVVEMSSYAPLLAKEGHTQWNPDLIYFNNTEVKPTVGYYVQKLFGQNSGETYIPATIQLADKTEDVKKRVAMSVVQDSQSKDVIVKLVNLLPEEVNAGMDLTGLNIADSEAILSVLKGTPDDNTAKPVMGKLQVSETFNYQLPAYSFSVIRIKTNK
ncbi:MAG: alpha-L-arabinofuranosidase C-terminal domain-containing protein [Labilibaculum antarcticum]